MDSKKSIFMVIAVAVLGGIIFSQLAVSPALAFVIGVVATFFVVKLSTSAPKQVSESSNSTKTLYVGNLPYKANESHVRDLFGEYGEVFAVRLMKDKRTGKRRGFGFVVMASSDVDAAISAINEKDYMQRTLKVRVANDPKHPEGEIIE
ncbi:RNA-binding protein [Vibrio sp. 10N.286.49.C2]|uniref:RNA recognition motif domain-containing protein n=1 Tax=unclassified Vibrio TaxID=2614977 RepID=UPI000C852533|nr:MULTISPECIES: RNA-binding protein [unclassified Vibrio]PMH37397.1 RNA-binding protein [Vibrio sp. 10N.286.49.C2]PMH49485.1 RNA-binding protein [Vibrio sp. 10N.286.49.B1]PMH81544.1 RNA-binding protein [Vibrio sp. 10N.286.48.B7]